MVVKNGWKAISRISQEAEGRMDRKAYQIPVEFEHVSERAHVGTGFPRVAAFLGFDSAEPYTIRLTFYVNNAAAPIVWSFSREILATGLSQQAGSMDVRAWPEMVAGHAYVYLRFSDRRNEGIFRVGWWIIMQFMREVDTMVPIGDASDYLGDILDQSIARLLSDGTRE